MQVIITDHAQKRLRDYRQEGICIEDIKEAALKVPGYIPTATRFRGFLSQNGRLFDIVAKDIVAGRLVITIIGK